MNEFKDGYKTGYLVDNIWWCTCSSLNSATLEKCNCGKTKQETQQTYPY